MSINDLVARLETLGVTVAAEGDRLHVDGPDAALTDELLAELRAHKSALLAGLARASALRPTDRPVARGDFGEAPTQPCRSCRQTAWRERPIAKGGGLTCDVCHSDPTRPAEAKPLGLRNLVALDVRLVATALGMDLDADEVAGRLLAGCPGLGDLDNLDRLTTVRACLLVGTGREPFADTPAALKEATDQVVGVWRSGDRDGARRLFAATVAPGLERAIDLPIHGDRLICAACQRVVDNLLDDGDGRLICVDCTEDEG
jgi:hypothetical protein